MRRASLGLPGALLSLVAFNALGCSDSLPTESTHEPAPVRFALRADAAQAFNDALDDVRGRVLPALSEEESAQSIAALLDALTFAIGQRDPSALLRALNQTEAALARAVSENEAIGTDLDAVRLILDHARPLANGENSTAKR